MNSRPRRSTSHPAFSLLLLLASGLVVASSSFAGARDTASDVHFATSGTPGIGDQRATPVASHSPSISAIIASPNRLGYDGLDWMPSPTLVPSGGLGETIVGVFACTTASPTLDDSEPCVSLAKAECPLAPQLPWLPATTDVDRIARRLAFPALIHQEASLLCGAARACSSFEPGAEEWFLGNDGGRLGLEIVVALYEDDRPLQTPTIFVPHRGQIIAAVQPAHCPNA